ncbi:MAG: hypothetical protein AAGJ82_15615, partial [Bacteroidota bacterium]
SQHQQLAQLHDPTETGVLWQRGETGVLYASATVQSFWLWSTQTLIHLGGQLNQDVTDLVLTQELNLFEAQALLWSEPQQRYANVAQDGSLYSSSTTAAFLPLFGQLPTQEIAEQLLVGLLEVDPHTISPAEAFLIYQGLQNYHIVGPAERWMRDWQELNLEKLSRYPYWVMLVSVY